MSGEHDSPPIRGLYTDLEGVRLPVTNLFDHNGEETHDISACHHYVAGPTPFGEWIVALVNVLPLVSLN